MHASFLSKPYLPLLEPAAPSGLSTYGCREKVLFALLRVGLGGQLLLGVLIMLTPPCVRERGM